MNDKIIFEDTKIKLSNNMNIKSNNQVLLSIDDLEKQYAIKRGAFYGMMKNGLKTIKMPGQRGKRLVRKSTLEAFLKKFEG